MKDTSTTIELTPAKWRSMTGINSASRVSEQKGDALIKVSAKELQGHLYTAFCTLYGSIGRNSTSTIYAYRLALLDLYQGETTRLYHDEDAVNEGRRKRGDHQGLIIKYKNKEYAMAQRVDLVMVLPDAVGVCMEELKAIEEEKREAGWRSHLYRDGNYEWKSYQGHPVLEYSTDDGRITRVLYCQEDGELEEVTLDDDLKLEPSAQALIVERVPSMTEGQMALF